ncbi:hypothetical protein BZA70DRAFT_265952 [Myxozyma melibiosi]|uniref:Uncharacterized protein n=1 Tax=Myxozyma melibiosi TaxID=54550 RepID=A0ABR1F9J3_9ASCO
MTDNVAAPNDDQNVGLPALNETATAEDVEMDEDPLWLDEDLYLHQLAEQARIEEMDMDDGSIVPEIVVGSADNHVVPLGNAPRIGRFKVIKPVVHRPVTRSQDTQDIGIHTRSKTKTVNKPKTSAFIVASCFIAAEMMMMMMNLFIIVYLQQLGYDRLSPTSSTNMFFFISIFLIQLQFFHLPDRISKYACLKWTTSYPVGASVQPLPEREGV